MQTWWKIEACPIAKNFTCGAQAPGGRGSCRANTTRTIRLLDEPRIERRIMWKRERSVNAQFAASPAPLSPQFTFCRWHAGRRIRDPIDRLKRSHPSGGRYVSATPPESARQPIRGERTCS
jgi:hypothetical protein